MGGSPHRCCAPASRCTGWVEGRAQAMLEGAAPLLCAGITVRDGIRFCGEVSHPASAVHLHCHGIAPAPAPLCMPHHRHVPPHPMRRFTPPCDSMVWTSPAWPSEWWASAVSERTRSALPRPWDARCGEVRERVGNARCAGGRQDVDQMARNCLCSPSSESSVPLIFCTFYFHAPHFPKCGHI